MSQIRTLKNIKQGAIKFEDQDTTEAKVIN